MSNLISFKKVNVLDSKTNRIVGAELELLIDGHSPNDTKAFDPIEFVAITNTNKNTFIYTCGCGDSGCAGINHGVYVKYRRHTVEWRDIDSKLNRRYYSFDINHYKAAQAQCIKLMYQLVKERNAIEKELIIDDIDYDTNELYNSMIVDYSSEASILRSIKYRQNYINNYRNKT